MWARHAPLQTATEMASTMWRGANELVVAEAAERRFLPWRPYLILDSVCSETPITKAASREAAIHTRADQGLLVTTCNHF